MRVKRKTSNPSNTALLDEVFALWSAAELITLATHTTIHVHTIHVHTIFMEAHIGAHHAQTPTTISR